MSDTKRLSERNAAIQAMLTSAEGIKDFYRFTAQNPHISLHDACQIVIQRPKASVCHSFVEWNDKRRYINRGSKGIAYYDGNGNKCYVFDARDTHAEQVFTRESDPIGKVLQEIDALNGTELFSDTHRDYAALCDGVAYWLHENGYLQDNAEENTLLAEGVSYSLWCGTDAAQEDDEIQLHGLPYDLQENADFCKNVYRLTAVLQREAAEAYVATLNMPKEVDDTDEETVSDEPEFSAVPQEEQGEEKPQISAPYRAYLAAQEKYPQAVVVQRLGDFYEVMGENAVTVGNELDITITSRLVGLPERVPMIGFPYHAADAYLEKILERHSVVMLEEKQEPKYIPSHADEVVQNAQTQTEEDEDFDAEEDFEEEYYEDEFSDEENSDDVFYDYTEEDEESNGVDEEYEDEEERPKGYNAPTNGNKRPQKRVQERKRKDSPQLSLFTALEPTREKSRKEEMIERQLKRGSGFESGKYRIMEMYRKNPTIKEFASFLKNEYGIGGYGGWGGDNQNHDGRGIEMKLRGEHGEVLEQAALKWTEVAERIADIIDNGDYLTADEAREYSVICARREERKNAKTDEEKIKVITRQAIRLGTQTTYTGKYEICPSMFEESAQFCRDHKAELTAALLQSEEVKTIYPTAFPYEDNIAAEFYPKYCERLQESDESLADKKHILQIVQAIIKNGTENTTQGNWIACFDTFNDDEDFVREHKNEIADALEGREEVSDVIIMSEGLDVNYYLNYCPNYEWKEGELEEDEPEQPVEIAPTFNRFKNVTEEDKAFYDSFTARYIPTPTQSLWSEVQHCRTIANGIYEVSTAGHGGVMIAQELAPHILSPEALQKGVRDGEYYCYEEDCDACIPLRELWDKGILTKTNEYFTNHYVNSHRPEAKNGSVPFVNATDVEKAEYFKWWNNAVDESLEEWNAEYWQAHEQDETVAVVQQLTIKETAEDKPTIKNTDLNEIGFDQSELGGAKTRYKGNVAAIRLLAQLEKENRTPAQEEKKTLASYVGWGGIAQVFDAENEQWKEEYNELKDLLSPKDYENAKGSVLNAHYTSKTVIDGIYTALSRFGLGGDSKKVKVLEPAMGTGNFFGFMPREIAESAKLYGVELDGITGKIAKYLYPQANVQIKGFEDTTFSDNSFDAVVGNVPFGAYSVYDKDYARQNMYIHDYFIAKSVDKLKPGGILAVVTSSGTLDKQNASARKYIADRAELVGAIRLPETAFKQTANTEVVADILLLQKRQSMIDATEENFEWLTTEKTEHGTSINSYFVTHPEMVLGELTFETGMYGAPNMTVKPDGSELRDALQSAVENLPQDIFTAPQDENITDDTVKSNERIEADYNVKPLCYKAENGKLYMRVGDEMIEQEIPKSPKDAYYRIKEMIALRNELRNILNRQSDGCSDEELTRAQWQLNARYDMFVQRYGILNSKTNGKLFKDDGDSALLFACENLSEDKKSATKADVFRKRTIQPYTVPTSTDDCMEALQISKNERGKVDIAYMEELTHKDFDTVLSELGNAVFRNPTTVRPEDKYSGYETAEEYLSGDVVAKLQTAKLAATQFPELDFARNVAALTEAQPQKLTASGIAVRIGASWVDIGYYKRFLCGLLDVQADGYNAEGIKLYYNPHDSSWRVDTTDRIRGITSMKATEVYGTNRASAFRLFEDALNLRDTTIYDTIQENGRDKQVVNQAETIAAREKQNRIREEFKTWIFADPARREDLERTYNATFNRIKLPKYDGSYLRFPGMNPAIELRPHQKDAVHRIVTDGNALLHHVVGSGKTYTICAAIMKLKQYGLAKKPMIAVPNHLVEQWAGEFRKLYPQANILVANKEDLEKENRKKFVSKVAMGDWDAVIIAQSSFAKINVSKARQLRKVQEEIASVERSIQAQKEDKNASRGSIKNLELIKKNREAQLKALTDDTKKDNVLIFEDLGVDYLFIDEAHYYKNLFLFTKMNNVAGISKAASKRASDLQMKCEYINELHGGDKGVVFATGTPISNSMAEMYTMQKYLQPSTLRDMGIEFFDGWAADFGETVTALEMAPSGKGYRPRTRFCKFTNLPELMTHYRSFADVQTADMVKLDVPEAEHITVTLKPSDTTIALAEGIADRAQRIYDGGVNSRVDNMLKVTSDGKKLALDPRCFVPLSADEPNGKINTCADKVFEIWQETREQRCTQLVFCDMSTPKKAFDDYVYGEDFDAYNELKYKLVQMGVPKEEIAFIHDANTDNSKQALFDSVNSGKVRVLIGSTEKCGAGTNVQQRLIALHHLDTPYRPSDLNQREGRIIRQGNGNKKVKIFTYVTERTFDSYSYQILENKQRFISQIDRGDLTVREAEDIDEATLSYAEIKAITSANPKIKRKMEVDAEVSRLRVLEGQYRKNLYALQDKVRKELPDEIQWCRQRIRHAEEDFRRVQESKRNTDGFRICVGDKEYTDRKEGYIALMEEMQKGVTNKVFAEYCGIKIFLNPFDPFSKITSVTLEGSGQYKVAVGTSAIGNMERIDNFLESFPERIEQSKQREAQACEDLKVAQEQLEKPFEHREKLDELLREQSALNAELDMEKKEIVVADEEDETSARPQDDDVAMTLPNNKVKEEDMIDRIDKTAKMKVDLYPDYTVSRDRMHEIGYTWDGMLPIRKDTARLLKGMDLPLFALHDNDTETEIKSDEDIDKHLGIFGVEKPDWIAFTKSETGKAFLGTKYLFTQAASDVVNNEMDYFDASFADPLSDDLFAERIHLETYAAKNGMPDTERMKPYVQSLMEYYGARFARLPFNEYGWDDDSVRRAILSKMPDGEIGKVMQETDLEKPFYYGKDTGNTAYYYLPNLSYNELTEIKEKADSYVIAAPKSALSDEIADKYNIFFLKTERDIAERELKNKDTAISSMQTAVHKVVKARHDEYLKALNYHTDCKNDLETAIRNNYDGMHINAGFENKLIHKYGLDEIAYVLANTVQYKYDDGRFSRDNKAWANSIVIEEKEGHRGQFVLETHPAVLDAFIDRIRRKQYKKASGKRTELYSINESTENGERLFTPVYLDEKSGEIGSLFHRGFPTETEAEEFIEKAMTDSRAPKRDYILEYVTPDELIAKRDEARKKLDEKNLQGEFVSVTKQGYSVVSMTKDGDNRNIAIIYRHTVGDFILAPRYDTQDGTWAQSYYFNSLESAERERAKQYGNNPKIYENKEWNKIPENHSETKQQAEEFMEQKYGVKQEGQKQAAKLKATVSGSAVIRLYNDRAFMRMPNTVEKYRGCTYNLRNRQFAMGKDDSGNEVVKISLPEDYVLRINGRNGESSEITAAEFTALVGGTTEEDYARVADNGWHYASVPATGKIMTLENSMLFRMPKGEYERYAYTIPSPFIRYNEERDSYAIGIPEDFTVSMKDNKSNDTVTMTAENFIAEIKGKTEGDYESAYRRPSEESKKRFAAVEERLRQSVPEEMKARPNWVVVRTQENEEKGRADTFMIDVHTGKSAQADDPNTWTDFDTACEYARENGGVALGYALDGNDQVACIDLDGCVKEDGKYTDIAERVIQCANKTYTEYSLDGNGLHILGMTYDTDLRTFGKDEDLAFYRKSHFVAMTGNGAGYSRLASFDTPDMKALLERKCEKRQDWNGAGKGVEGLSAMGDRDVVEKACSAAKGDVFSALYRGEDLKKNREKSDMSLMNRLAFWCNGDKEQMLRIFATSGLYRPDKSPDYYENAAIKAVQDTVDRYQPKDKPSDKPSVSKPSDNGSGKR